MLRPKENQTDPNLKSIFIHPTESRLRAGWRILLFLILFWLLAALIFVIRPLFGDVSKREFLADYSLIIVGILALAATIAVKIARKKLDKKSWVSLGLRISTNTWKDLLFGFMLSGIMAGTFLGALWAIGVVEIDIQSLTASHSGPAEGFASYMKVISWGSLVLLFLEHLLVGYWEELVFRGYLLQNMIEGMGLQLAVVISCIGYGLIHAGNPNAGLLSTGIIVLFGFLRIYGYLATKMLWLSMGMHIGWNFFQGPVFGFAASGHQKATWLQLRFLSESSWLTGGDFGPEGSLLMLPILGLAILVMYGYVKNTRHHR